MGFSHIADILMMTICQDWAVTEKAEKYIFGNEKALSR